MVFFIQVVSLLICVFIVDGERCLSNTSLPIPLYAHQIGYYSTSHVLYVFGGKSGSDEYHNSIYKWDINPNTWTQLSTNTPTNEFFSFVNSAVTIEDIVYFIGTDDGAYYDSGKVYRFHLSTEQWLSPDSINKQMHPSVAGCLTHNNTHILMIGGRSSSTTFIDQLQIYSVSTNVWSTETINVSPIHGTGWTQGYCHIIGVDLYIFGGGTTNLDGDQIDNIFKYNPADKWTSIGHLPQVQGWGSATYNERSGAIYVVGGWIGSAVNPTVDTIYVFDVDTETITDTWTMNHARCSAPTAIINDNLYVFGGEPVYVDSEVTALSNIDVCAIPHAITMDPSTNPSAFPSRNPSVSLTNNPSKYPSDDPSTAPIHNPSVSPTKQPSDFPSSVSTSQPPHPTLRADIPSLFESSKSISTVDVTHDDSSTETMNNTESAEDMMGQSDPSMMIMWIVASSVLIVCIVVVYRMMIRKQRKADVVCHVERMSPQLDDVGAVVSPPKIVKRIETPNGVSTNDDTNAVINVELVMQGSAKVTQGHQREDSNSSASSGDLWQVTKQDQVQTTKGEK